MAEGNLVGSSIRLTTSWQGCSWLVTPKPLGSFWTEDPEASDSSQGQRSLLTAPWLRVAPGAHCDGRARNAERGWSPAGQLLVRCRQNLQEGIKRRPSPLGGVKQVGGHLWIMQVQGSAHQRGRGVYPSCKPAFPSRCQPHTYRAIGRLQAPARGFTWVNQG